MIDRQPQGRLFNRTLADWRVQCRRELGLAVEEPIIATGHQTLLWHPGILAKYLAVDSLAAKHGWVTANLVVDQHAAPPSFGEFEIPIRRADGSLGSRKVDLCRPQPHPSVPMGRHEAFTPPRPPENLGSSAALPSVQTGVQRIFDAAYAHRHANNAATQMAAALADLMRPWVQPMANVTSSNMIGTSLAGAIMRAMADDPQRCAASYNHAVQRVPEAGIGTLLIRDDYVELPLWRIRDDGRRMHAYDSDVMHTLSAQGPADDAQKLAIDLLPRALFMTALVRLGLCDLFIHGTGGARYDRAMEIWIKDWLGIEVGSIAVATATLCLPLMPAEQQPIDLQRAITNARHSWHDPEGSNKHGAPSPEKRGLLDDLEQWPRRSPQRKAAFLRMHDRLAELRRTYDHKISAAQDDADRAKRLAADAAIANRRDWAFPLYPDQMIDELSSAVRRSCGCEVNQPSQ